MPQLSRTNLQKELRKLADPKRANFLGRYFKTGKGEYAEGDIFLGGINTATSRTFVKKYQSLTLSNIKELLQSKYHEERGIGTGILVNQFTKAEWDKKSQLYHFYLQNTSHFNNWDLVDGSADKIVGQYLILHPNKVTILDKLAKSKILWNRRIAIMATFAFIKKGEFTTTLEIAETLLHDKQDLIHKAVGWMLREIGKRDLKTEEKFLKKYYQHLPRTMLRYAIERFPEEKRQQYLRTKV